MSSDKTKDDLLKISGPLPFSANVLEAATPVQTQILITLNEQNRAQDKTNTKLFDKLDEAANLARTAVSTAEASHAETMGIKVQIDQKFRELNGTISKAKLDIQALEKKDQERAEMALTGAIESKAVKAVTEGVFIIPKPTWRQLTVAGGVIAFVGLDRILAVSKTIIHLVDNLRGLQ
jgi:hypothetical protein